MPANANQRLKLIKLVAAVLFCEGAGLLGGVATYSSVATWYQTLAKPFFTPPSWVFGPAWILLYFLMGMSLFRAQMKKAPLKWFYLQLGLNVLWSFLFFGFHELGLALVEIVVLLAAIVATILEFQKKDSLAAKLLLPYVGWVSFATLLTFSLWLLN